MLSFHFFYDFLDFQIDFNIMYSMINKLAINTLIIYKFLINIRNYPS